MLEDVALLLRMLIFFLLRRKNFAFTMCIYFLQVATVFYKWRLCFTSYIAASNRPPTI